MLGIDIPIQFIMRSIRYCEFFFAATVRCDNDSFHKGNEFEKLHPLNSYIFDLGH